MIYIIYHFADINISKEFSSVPVHSAVLPKTSLDTVEKKVPSVSSVQ